MKMRDAAEVTLSILGVFRLVRAATEIPNAMFAFYMYRQAGRPDFDTTRTALLLLRTVSEFAVNLVAGIFLLVLAGRIADWLARRSAPLAGADVELRIVSPEGFRFCLKIIGISVALAGITGLTRLPAFHWAWLASAPLAIALGIYLIFGGKWLTRFAWGKAGE